MIVVDTNIIAYLYLPTELTGHAERLLETDPEWVAPLLWRSEFRNVLALYLRKGLLTLADAVRIQDEAEALLAEQEYSTVSRDVLGLVAASSCSAYDCEFVALARTLKVKLVTMDRKILAEFPETAISLEDALQ
jgi:predicted nucleic acid-binding protein